MTIYSRLLWAESGGAGPRSFVVAPPPRVVVVRDMRFTWSSDSINQIPGGFQVYDTAGNYLWSVRAPYARAHYTHSWDGRLVLSPDNNVNIQTFDDRWTWIISGYVFSS